MPGKIQPLVDRDVDALKLLAKDGRKWVYLSAIGGTKGSYHRKTAQKLIRHGLAEAKVVLVRGGQSLSMYRATNAGIKKAAAE